MIACAVVAGQQVASVASGGSAGRTPATEPIGRHEIVRLEQDGASAEPIERPGEWDEKGVTWKRKFASGWANWRPRRDRLRFATRSEAKASGCGRRQSRLKWDVQDSGNGVERKRDDVVDSAWSGAIES